MSATRLSLLPNHHPQLAELLYEIDDKVRQIELVGLKPELVDPKPDELVGRKLTEPLS